MLFVYHTKMVVQAFSPRIKLDGLADGVYKVTEMNCDKSCFWGDGREFDSDFLENYGLNLKLRNPLTSAVFLLEQVSHVDVERP